MNTKLNQRCHSKSERRDVGLYLVDRWIDGLCHYCDCVTEVVPDVFYFLYTLLLLVFLLLYILLYIVYCVIPISVAQFTLFIVHIKCGDLISPHFLPMAESRLAIIYVRLLDLI